LSGESEFTEQGATHDFRKFYETRIKILEKESSHGPKARARYDDLMKYFNDNLFPSEDAAEPDVDEEEATLFHAISDEEKESEDGDEDEQPVNE
jgi:hypothetical protein